MNAHAELHDPASTRADRPQDQDDDDLRTDANEVALVSRMEIRGLFGRYNYDIEVPLEARSERLLLFYADNGKGKTTVLRLLWHLLSSENDRGHRTSIGQIAFGSIRVELADGAEIRASRAAATDGPYVLRLQRDGKTLSETEWAGSGEHGNRFAGWELSQIREQLRHMPDDLKREAREFIARSAYIDYLVGLKARPYFLADDRNIYSDELDDSPRLRRGAAREAQLSREYQTLLDSRHAGASSPETTQGSVAQELETSLRRANDMLGQMTLGATASGSASANSVYLDVLRRLAGTTTGPHDDREDPLPELVDRLDKLGSRSREFERLGLVPKLGSADFIQALRALQVDRVSIAEEVLAPFVDSLAARLDALQNAQSLIRTFLDQTNGFLIDKELTFDPSRGLRIKLKEGPILRSAQLSSGGTPARVIALQCFAGPTRN